MSNKFFRKLVSSTQSKSYQFHLYIGKYKLKPKCKLSHDSGIKLEKITWWYQLWNIPNVKCINKLYLTHNVGESEGKYKTCNVQFHLNRNWPKLICNSYTQSIKIMLKALDTKQLEASLLDRRKAYDLYLSLLLQGIFQTAAEGHLVQAVSASLPGKERRL